MKANELAVRAVRAARRRVRRDSGFPAFSFAHGPAKKFRLVPEPVFILSYMRSGSTLLRVLLNSHSQICAPHEMHLRTLKVTATGPLTRASLEELNLTPRDLENMLWDRILFNCRLKAGKPVIVDKTPANVLTWRRLHRYWPQSKFILLYRHPMRILGSWSEARPDISEERSVPQLLRFTQEMEAARAKHGGFVVRYEDLTREPAEITQRICDYLGVPWEPQMIEYGSGDHGNFVRGLGDWNDKIRSGRIEPAPPDPRPEDVPDELKEICRLMGYI